MKYLAVLLVVINVAVYFSMRTAGSDDIRVVDEASSTLNTAQECYVLESSERTPIDQLTAATERLGGAVRIEEREQWVDGSNWWLVSASANPSNVSSYRQVVPQAYIVANGPRAGHLSLGIFQNEANARRLMAQFDRNLTNVELLRYQQKAPLWRVIVSGPQVEVLINRYQLEFIEKKSC